MSDKLIDGSDLLQNLSAEQDSGKHEVNDIVNETANQDEDADIAVVHATASLRNCPHSTVDDVTLDAISKILRSTEHNQSNINSFKYGNIRNRPMFRGSSHYMHEVEINLEVIRSRIWDSARSYLWKSFGTSTWTLYDGTQVTFIKIHQK